MKAPCSGLMAMLLLLGCSTAPLKEEAHTEPPVRFDCGNHGTVEARFVPEKDTALLSFGGRQATLKRRPAASGFWYTDGRISIRGKGDELMLEIGRMAPVFCKVKQQALPQEKK